MNVLFVGINSKYIHPAASIILLSKNLRYQNRILEFTIKDSISQMIDTILSNDFDLLGISTYIWNVTIIETLLLDLKPKLKPNQKIVLGGPEVSYDQAHFMNLFRVDYIISGEGEESINQLCEFLEGIRPIEQVTNLSYWHGCEIVTNPYKLPNINYIQFGHDLIKDKTSRIVYFETSRGCPFQCSYCVASLEKKVRHFDITYVKNELKHLFDAKVPLIKFLDRTFNINKPYMIDLLDFIDQYNTNNSVLQFEIVADILDEAIIDRISFMKTNCLRFEIGIQSTNDLTTKAVKRKQNFDLLKQNITLLQNTKKVDLHLDLIAGLPYEDYHSFQKTFNDTLSLKPKEMQLGFLKMLRGTKLRADSDKYHYRYNSDPPYELIDNQFISINELSDIRLVEECLEKYYNSAFMPLTMNYILNQLLTPSSYFSFFLDFGKFLLRSSFSFSRYQLDELFSHLSKYIYDCFNTDYLYIQFLLKQDYLTHYRNRPKIWWDDKPTKQLKNQLIKTHYHQLPLQDVTIDELYHYGHLEIYERNLFLIIYHPHKYQYVLFSIS